MKGKRLAEGGFINLQSQEGGVFPCSTFPSSPSRQTEPRGELPIDKVATVCQIFLPASLIKSLKVSSIVPAPTRAACSSLGFPDLLFSSGPAHSCLSPLHHFLPSPGYRSKYITIWKARLWQKITYFVGLAENYKKKPTSVLSVDVSPLRNISLGLLADSMLCRPGDINRHTP